MPKDYDIAKATGKCARCGRELRPGETFITALRRKPGELLREDCCPSCWDSGGADDTSDILGTWRGVVPHPEEKRKLFVGDDTLIDLFANLEGAEAAEKVDFRFVLGLLLMRKKQLVYEATESTSEEADVWRVRIKGRQDRFHLRDPHMDEAKIVEVSRQLDQILESAP